MTLGKPGRYPGFASGNGRKISAGYGLLRNSTKIAAQFSGLGQSSQNPPVTGGNLKQRPDGSRRQIPDTVPQIARYTMHRGGVLNRGRGRGEAPRKHQVAFSGANESGAFCEDCLSPDFCTAKMVEFRNSHFRSRSCGPFAELLPGRARLATQHVR